MTDEEIRTFLKRAKGLACARKHPQLADDFAQEAYIAVARGRKATLEQLFIDFLRAEYGRTGIGGNPGGKLKAAGRRSQLGFDSRPAGDDGYALSEIIAAPHGDPEPHGDDWRDRVALRGAAAAIYAICIEEECSHEEAAAVLGVSPSRVSQIFHGAVKKEVERAHVMTETMPLYHDDPEYSKLVIGWIKF